MGIDWKKLKLNEVLLLEKIGRNVRAKIARESDDKGKHDEQRENGGLTSGISPVRLDSPQNNIQNTSDISNGDDASIVVDAGLSVNEDDDDDQPPLRATLEGNIHPTTSSQHRSDSQLPGNGRRSPVLQSGVDEETISVISHTRASSRAQTPQSLRDSVKTSPRKAFEGSNSVQGIKIINITGYQRFQSEDDEIQREAGVPRVYFNPAGSARPRPPKVRGRPRSSCIAVFKSNKLKDPELLEKNKGSWIEVLAAKTENSALEVSPIEEDSTPERPSKRPRTSNPSDGAPLQSSGRNTTSVQPIAPLQASIDVSNSATTNSNSASFVRQHISPTSNISTQSTYQSPYTSNRKSVVVPTGNLYESPYRSPYQSTSQIQPGEPNPQPGTYKSVYASTTSTTTQSRPPLPTSPPTNQYKSPYQTRSSPSNPSKPYKSPYLTQPAPTRPYVSPFKAPSQSPTIQDTNSTTKDYATPSGPSTSLTLPSDTTFNAVSAQKLPKTHISPYKPLDKPEHEPQVPAKDPSLSTNVPQTSSSDEPCSQAEPVTVNDHPQNSNIAENSSSAAVEAPGPPRRKRGRPRRIPVELSAEEIELQERLAAAEAVTIASSAARLSSIWNNTLGNLVLSEDKATLSFLAMDQSATESPPKLSLGVNQMTKNPVTSVRGSKPMELLIFVKDEDDTDVTYRFIFSSVDSSYQAANNMRAKLVTAMIISGMKDTEDEEDEEGYRVQMNAEKPFVCEICGNRWKNKEGILYHKTRSNTTCNPNFNPAEYTREHWTVKKKRRLLESPVELDDGILDDGEEISEDVSSKDQAIASIENAEESANETGVRRQPRRAAREAARRILKKRIVPAETRGSPEMIQEERSDIRTKGPDTAYVSPYVSLGQSRQALDIVGDISSDDSYEEEKPKRKRKAKAKSRRSETPMTAVDKFGLLNQTWTSIERPDSVSSVEPPTRAAEVKGRRLKASKVRLDTWPTAKAFLPNQRNGAWNQTPYRAKKQIKRRPQLPEPITFMQSEKDATWSFRPYGHGAWPIYARPSRRIEGKPGLADYLERIGNGHRPVILPGRVTPYPASPSKQQVRQASAAASPSSSRSTKQPGGGRRAARQGNSGRQQKAKLGSAESEELAVSFLPRSDGQLNPGLESLPRSFGLRLPEMASHSATLNGARYTEDKVSVGELGESYRISPEAVSDLSWLVASSSDSFAGSDVVSIIQDGPSQDSSVPESPSHAFELEIDTLAKWEQTEGQSLLSLESFAPKYKFINHSVDHVESPSVVSALNLQWNDQNFFNLFTLPYDELDNVVEAIIPEAVQSNRPGQRARGSAITDTPTEPRKYQRFHTTRYQVAIASDFEGILGTPDAAAAEVGVELMPMLQHQPRKRTLDGSMSPEMENRFIVAAVVLRTLTGGLDSQIDWVLIELVLPHYSMHWLKRKWPQIVEQKKTLIEKISADFQELFLESYAAHEIPPLDYDHLASYDWNWLVDWALQRLDTSSEQSKTKKSKEVSLPSDRAILDKQFAVSKTGTSSNWRDTYFGLLPPVYKRMELASSVPYTTPLKAPEEKDEIDDITLVKSWTRATCFTPDSSWDSRIAAAKLRSVPESVAEKALESLLTSKVLMHKAKGRAVPGRPYDATELFYASLRKHITESMFIEAAAYKSFLDDCFRSGSECVRFDYFANEGTVMCVTNLQAQGRIRLVGVGVPNDRFGLTEGGYETRKLDKAKYRFDVDIYPASTYVFDSDNPTLKALAQNPAPMEGKRGELPLWLDIQGKVIDSLWKKSIAGVFGIVSLRSGIPTSGLATIFSPALEEWELRRLMSWGADVGALSRVMEGIDGWTTGEWWWLVAGKICSA